MILLVLAAVQWSALAQAPTPDISSIRRNADSLTLEWLTTGPGQAYSIQSRNQLAGGLWVLAESDQPWPIASTVWNAPMSFEGSTRFYRVLGVPAADRGRVLAAQLLQTMTTGEIGFLFTLAGIPVTPQYAVQVHKIVYETIDPWGARTRASGLLLLPQGASLALPLASYQHGTLIQTNEAPSLPANIAERVPGIGLATTGYAATIPDFLGFGDSPGFHPYHHARSEATASVDMLRAARTWCATNGVTLNGQLFLLGYSQGGHATMALHRELETYHSGEFSVTASAPMAGAYDLSGVTAEDFLSGRQQPNPYYLLYLLAAYLEVYPFADALPDLLAAPYDATLPPLLARRASSGEINAAMPSDPALVLKPEVLASFQSDPNHPLRVALRDNDLYAWSPAAPMRLFHCLGDQDVPFANSETALASFHALGAAQVELIDPQPSADHGDCALPSFLQVKAWFDSLRQ